MIDDGGAPITAFSKISASLRQAGDKILLEAGEPCVGPCRESRGRLFDHDSLDDLPEPPGQVFMLATPAHMLTKLHWEIYSLRKALTEKPEHIGHTHAPAYCAFNCAVTAWHLADWVWKASSVDRRADILASLGTTAANDRKDFGKFQTAIRNKSRALHLPTACDWFEAHERHRLPRPKCASRNAMGEGTRSCRENALR